MTTKPPLPRTFTSPSKLETYLLPADVGFTRGTSTVSKLIRFFTRAKGEPPTYTNHTLGIGNGHNVVQALAKVSEMPIEKWAAKVPEFEIWRKPNMEQLQRFHIADTAEAHIGQVYGSLKIVAHLGDAFLTWVKGSGKSVRFFRRLCLMRDYPICSWLWGWAYSAHGERLSEIGPRYACPDDQHDYVSASPEWVKVAAKYANGDIAIYTLGEG